MSTSLIEIFEQEYRELRPRAPIPPLDIRFRRFTSLNTTIRLREGRLQVRLSDLLEHAPESVHHAIAHILLAKLYKKLPIERVHADRYRRYVSSEAVARQAEHIRQTRGRKTILTAKGHHYDLDEVFESLNARFFHGLLGRPLLTWSAHHARRMLGHYDAAHNTIMVSRVFDRARHAALRRRVSAVPRDAAPEASGAGEGRAAVRALQGVPGGRAAVPGAGRGQGVSEAAVDRYSNALTISPELRANLL